MTLILNYNLHQYQKHIGLPAQLTRCNNSAIDLVALLVSGRPSDALLQTNIRTLCACLSPAAVRTIAIHHTCKLCLQVSSPCNQPEDGGAHSQKNGHH